MFEAKRFKVIAAAGLVLCVAGDQVEAQSFQTIKAFSASDFGSPDQVFPVGVSAIGSNLYAATSDLISGGYPGSVVSLNSDGTDFHVIHTFSQSDGLDYTTYSDLTIDGSTLYGRTVNHGFFALASDGSSYQWHSEPLSNLAAPRGNLAVSGAMLFGTSPSGGGAGEVYSESPDGSNFQVLHAFDSSVPDGAAPFAGLTVAGSKLYGTTAETGLGGGSGTVFSTNLDGSDFQLLHSFSGGDGARPFGPLLLIGSALYGTTWLGGSGGKGTIFSVNTDGSNFQSLHQFAADGSEGFEPVAQNLVHIGSTLYGANAGALFSLNTDGSGFQVVHSFSNSGAVGSLAVIGSTIYGATIGGGVNGDGTIYALTVPEPSTWALGVLGALCCLSAKLRRLWIGGLLQGRCQMFEAKRFKVIAAAGLVLCVAGDQVEAQSFQTIKAFSASDFGTSQPVTPAGVCAIGAKLYTPAEYSGLGGVPSYPGSIVSINPDGSDLQVIHAFTNSDPLSFPSYSDITVSGDTIYGVHNRGPTMTSDFYSLNADGSDFQVHSLWVGITDDPFGNLAIDGGTVYGTSLLGSDVYAVNADGSNLRMLHVVQDPTSGVTVSGGKVFGTLSGVLGGSGGLFSMNLDGSDYQLLHTFSGSDGAAPWGPLLVIGSTLYGTTRGGGNNDAGTIFSINTDGSNFQSLHQFAADGSQGGDPIAQNLVDIGSTLYGANSHALFSLSTDGSNFQVLHDFRPTEFPVGSLAVIGSTIYGATFGGGVNGDGTIYALTVPEPSTWALGALGAAACLAAKMLRSRARERPPSKS